MKDFCTIDIDFETDMDMDISIENSNDIAHDNHHIKGTHFNIFRICEFCATNNNEFSLSDTAEAKVDSPGVKTTHEANNATPNISPDLATPTRSSHFDYFNCTPHIPNYSTPLSLKHSYMPYSSNSPANPNLFDIDTPSASDLDSYAENSDQVTSQPPEQSTLSNQIAESETSQHTELSSLGNQTAELASLGIDGKNAIDILKNIRIKNVNRITIATLNINSLASKFEQLREVIGNSIDILTIQETKLDSSFPKDQFLLDGYSEPYRLDRNKHGGGVMIYVREDIPSKLLVKHNFTKPIEGLFIEINLRKTKLLFFGSYRSDHQLYGVKPVDFFEEIGLALDMYNYDKFLLAGDFNVDKKEAIIEDFIEERNAKNLVKEDTCFMSTVNPSCIDVLITNSNLSFQNTTNIWTGLSDHHTMVVTVMKTTFPKLPPRIIEYRDYKKFDQTVFHRELMEKLRSEQVNYANFEDKFLEVLNKHAPIKKKVVRANDKPFMTKALRKAIMQRSALKNVYIKEKTEAAERAFRKQRNFTNKLLKKEKKKYFGNLDLNDITDNKKFWKTIKPFFSNGSGHSGKITLVEDKEIITDDKEIAETFNNFYVDVVSSLGIDGNKALENDTSGITDPVLKAVKRFEDHPSILEIKKNVTIDTEFSFSEVTKEEMLIEIDKLKVKKAGTYMNIPTRILKEAKDVVAEPLMQIWKNEVIMNKKFPSKLKLADITPIFKKLQNIKKENYRPVSLLPVVSKIFERIMQNQMLPFIENILSDFLCGYRKNYNAQYALLAMIDKWKRTLDKKGGMIGAVLMDLSKAFDTVNHDLLIAKLKFYGFGDNALHILQDYLSDRWQRTKINTSFSDWKELSCGVPQGSVLGPLLFNIYLNDLFYLFINTHPTNFADDTTISACDVKLEDLLHNLEDEALTVILWFDYNYMKLNQSKCHFLTCGVREELWTKVGDAMIWESSAQKLLGVTVDKHLKFNEHLRIICKKVGAKISALGRVVRILPFYKRLLIMKTFIESQFSYCPLVWMFCSCAMNRKINYLHARALRLVYDDYTSTYQELLCKDKSMCFHHKNIHLVAIEIYKAKNDLSPPFMKEIFATSQTRETRSGDTLVRPHVRNVNTGERTLRNFGAIVWNTMLPKELKSSASLEIFKNAIKSWIPDNCDCVLCRVNIEGVGRIKRSEIFE
jgi:exonuclease III/predicted transport protein